MSLKTRVEKLERECPDRHARLWYVWLDESGVILGGSDDALVAPFLGRRYDAVSSSPVFAGPLKAYIGFDPREV